MPGHQKIAKAVIPAAGFGTRMLPATKAVPKEMLPVAGKPLIQYAVEEAAASGIETVILVIRNHKSLIQAHFSRDHELESFLEDRQQHTAAELVRRLAELVSIRYVEQEKPLGLAHAISCARPLIGEEPFALLLPDVVVVSDEPVTHQLIRAHEQHGGSVVAVQEIELQDVERYGIISVECPSAFFRSKSVRVTGLAEKPSADQAPSRLGIFGRYLLEPTIWDTITRTHPDSRREAQLTDALNLLCKERPLYGLISEGQHYDAGDRVGYLRANIALSLRDPYLQQPILEYLSHLSKLAEKLPQLSSVPPCTVSGR